MTVVTDALAPYALIIRLVLWGVLAGGLFVSGCRYGEKTATAEAAEQVRTAQASAGHALATAHACGLTLREVSAQGTCPRAHHNTGRAGGSRIPRTASRRSAGRRGARCRPTRYSGGNSVLHTWRPSRSVVSVPGSAVWSPRRMWTTSTGTTATMHRSTCSRFATLAIAARRPRRTAASGHHAGVRLSGSMACCAIRKTGPIAHDGQGMGNVGGVCLAIGAPPFLRVSTEFDFQVHVMARHKQPDELARLKGADKQNSQRYKRQVPKSD